MNANIMMILSEAIRKGAKPYFTEDGHKAISVFIDPDNSKENKVGA